MAAVYDIQVRNALCTYERALVGYPISIQRRKIKIKRLRSFLQALSRNVDIYPICNSKKLGQFFDVDGNPIFLNLKQGNYEDESGTQWRMSFFRISANKVKIYRLYQSGSIDESKLKKKLFIENNNSTSKFRIMNIQNKQPIRLTESQLSQMIRETVKRVIKEENSEKMLKEYFAFGNEDTSYKDFNNALADISRQLQQALRTINLSNNAFQRIGNKWSEFEDFIYNEMNRHH